MDTITSERIDMWYTFDNTKCDDGLEDALLDLPRCKETIFNRLCGKAMFEYDCLGEVQLYKACDQRNLNDVVKMHLKEPEVKGPQRCALCSDIINQAQTSTINHHVVHPGCRDTRFEMTEERRELIQELCRG